jgi:hypothetical protein
MDGRSSVIDRGWSRRQVLASVAALGGGLLGGGARAELNCSAVPGGQVCDALIRTSRFASVRAVQETLVWCWAATLEMIFRWHGKSISQSSIVSQTFGGPVVTTANPLVLINAVNRDYRDDLGRRFRVRSRVWGPDYGLAQIDNRTVIESLRRERPLVVCNLSHMMALVGVNFVQGPMGLQIRQAWVADPMLVGQVSPDLAAGFRYLLPPELVPATQGGQLRFMADVSLS